MTHGMSVSGSGLRIVLGMMFVLLLADPLAAQSNNVFDATTGYVVVPHSPALDFGAQLTVEAWIRPGPPTSAFGAAVDKDYLVGYSLGVESLHPVMDTVLVRLYLGGIGAVGPRIRADNTTWTHVAATVDTIAHQVIFYINGQLTMTSTGPLARFSVVPENVTIGRSKYGDEFAGLIDEVRIWNVVRSHSDIVSLYPHEAKGNEPGLVAAYHFEDARDTVAWNRAAGGGLNGSLSPGAQIVQDYWDFAFVDEHEPNNSFADATPMSSLSRFLYASVAPGDTDTYKIYMRPGDVLNGGTEPASPGDQLTFGLMVVGPDSTTVLYDYEGLYPSLDAAASVEGYRYIRIHAGSGPGGSYVLGPFLGDFYEVDVFEPNNAMGEATPMPWGTLAMPTLFPGIDVGIAVPDTDYFSVTGDAGDIGLFLFSQEGGGSGNGMLIPFGPSGSLGYSFPSHVANVAFPTTGTYYARVHLYRGAIRYRLGLFKGLTDINGMLYDPATYGARVCLVAGWGRAYSQAYRLLIDGRQYHNVPDYSIVEADGRQFVFLSTAMSGLDVSRKFFVPTAAQGDSLGYMRIQEILSNPTGSPITVKVAVRSDLGAPLGVGAAWTSSEDSEVTPADYWAVTTHSAPPEGVPALTHIIDGIGGADRVDSLSLVLDNLYWEWRDVTVPAGETRILMYYVAQDTVLSNAMQKGPAFSGSVLPVASIVGLGADGYNVLNWPTELLVGVEEAEAVPELYSLAQNYPNPFNPTTTIRFTIPYSARTRPSEPAAHGRDGSPSDPRGPGGSHVAGNVRLVVYDLLGRQMAVLVDEKKAPGSYDVKFDARNLASGMYLYRLTAGSFVETKKMLLMK